MFSFDKTTFKSEKDKYGNFFVGQFSTETCKKSGIIRKFSGTGDFLSEMIMHDNKVVGLARHIDTSGCVAYIITRQDSTVLESKFYDPEGEPINS